MSFWDEMYKPCPRHPGERKDVLKGKRLVCSACEREAYDAAHGTVNGMPVER